MRGILLVCGGVGPTAGPSAGFDRVVEVPARPGKADVDALLPDAGRITVAGDDADLAAVVLRLLRRELLGAVDVGFLPPPGSAVAALWGLPTDAARAVELATAGAARPVPLLRDDTGGVLVGRGVLLDVTGVGYCDDQLALRGSARRIEVQPDADAGLQVRVTRGQLRRRTETFRGRAFQYGGPVSVTPELDGVQRNRTVSKWTWYRHTEDLRLIRP